MHRIFNRFLAFVGVLGLLHFWGFTALAAEYPIKSIYLVTPWGAGGAIDTATRSLANAAKKFLGQPVVAENKTGGGRNGGYHSCHYQTAGWIHDWHHFPSAYSCLLSYGKA